jgi:hypothetical protein
MNSFENQGIMSVREKRLKVITITLSIVAALLFGFLAWIWIDRSKMIDDLKTDKEELTLVRLSDPEPDELAP